MECRAAARGRISILCVQRLREIRGAVHARARPQVRNALGLTRETACQEALQEWATGTGSNRTWPTPPLTLTRSGLRIWRETNWLMFPLYFRRTGSLFRPSPELFRRPASEEIFSSP